MWTIHLLKNTLSVSITCKLQVMGEYCRINGLDLVPELLYDNGKLDFFEDDMEHMDYIGNSEKIRKILCNHKATGIVCFGDFEGDNQGELWGHAFDRSGKYHKLTGEIIWK